LTVKTGCRLLVETGLPVVYLDFIHLIRFDCMAIGGLGSVLIIREHKFRQIVFNPLIQLTAWAIVLAVLFERFHLIYLYDHEIYAVFIVVLICNLAFNPRSLIRFNNSFFDFLGRISFGIYVYHILIIDLITRIASYINLPLLIKAPLLYLLIILSTIAVSWLSYRYFEKRFIDKKSSYSPIRSSM